MRAKFLPTKHYLTWFALLVITLFTSLAQAQQREYAQVIVDQNHTIDQANAIDNDLSTKALVRASSGDLLGFGAYAGYMELQFNQRLAANTTTYIKIDADSNILTALLGGSLGNLISDVTGHLLIGNQEFRVQALLDSNPVLTVNSQVDGDFSQPRARILINADKEYFIAITPNQSYDRIKVTNRLGSVIGFGNTKDLGVYGAYYSSTPDPCSAAVYTSYSGEGINIDALDIGGVGVSNPENVLDANPNNYSRMSMGVTSVAGAVEQTVYFEGLSNATDTYTIRLKLDPSLLTAGVANAIYIIARNGAGEVTRTSLASLLNADLLTLLQGNAAVSIPFSPGAPTDRITVEYVALLNVNLTQRLDFYGVSRAPALPEVVANSLNVTACVGTTAELTATTVEANLDLNWYDSLEATSPLATVTSGQVFTTPPIVGDTVFYVASVKTGCTEESARIAVPISALAIPVSTDITIEGIESPYCENSTVTLQPTSSVNGSFTWFLDEDKTVQITDGLTLSGVSYTFNADGHLTIIGLTPQATPYQFYVSLQNVNGCENAAGDLQVASIVVIPTTVVPTLSLDENITADDIIQLSESSQTIIIEGSVGGDAQEGDPINLLINAKNYTGTVAANLRFSIEVQGSDLAADPDRIIEASLESSNGNCAGIAVDTEGYSVDLSLTPLTQPTVNAQNTNDATPVITGTADSSDDLTVEVDGVLYTENDGDLVDHGDDTWTLTIPETNAIADGTYDVVATVSDNAGNSVIDATTDELTIDTSTNPTVLTQPTVNAQNTNDATPVITGTADSSDDLTVEVDGVLYTENEGDLVDHGDDTWTLTIPEANELTDGIYDVVATVSDNAGNSVIDATTDELTIDTTTNPTVLTQPTVNAQNTNDTTPVIIGTADSSDNLTVEVDGVVYTENDGHLVDQGDDTWTLTIPETNAIADGTYDVVATVSDNAGNSVIDATIDELTIDTTTNPTVLTQPTVNTQNTNDTTPVIIGTADSSDNLTVEVDGVVYKENDGDLVDHGDDTWTLTIPEANELTDGIYDVVATVSDNAGNSVIDATTDELTIDTTTIPTVLTQPTVDVLNSNDATPVITGTADSSDDLTVEVDGVLYTENDGDLVDHGDDTWTLTIPEANELTDGIYDVVATVSDNAGNSVIDATTDELTIDTTTIPTVLTQPTVDVLNSNDATPVITGTADSSDNLTVEVDGVVYTENDGDLVDHGDDTWTLTIPEANELTDGIYDVVATVSDNAGNSVIDATTDELTIDTTTIPTVLTQPTVDVLNSNDATPVITGTADSSDDLTVEVDGVVYTENDGDLVDHGDDTWTLTIPEANELTDGIYDVVATVSDNAGNSVIDATTDELTIDTTTIPTVLTQPTVDVLNSNDATPIITGTADSSDDLTVEVDGVLYTENDGDLVDHGDDTWTLTIPEANELTDGIYDVVATVSDNAGNSVIDATTDELTIDTTTNPTVLTQPTVNAQNTNDTTPIITGTADSSDDLTVEVDGVVYTENDGDLVDHGDNTWTLTIPEANELTDGIYDVVATVSDNAGNSVIDATTDELTIDTTTIPTVLTQPTVNAQNTNDTTPVIIGTADSSDDLTVEVDGVVYTENDGHLVDHGDDTWTLTIPEANELTDGIYDVVATVSDNAGNSVIDATTDELTIDTMTNPTVLTQPTVNAQNTNDTTPVIIGTADSSDNLTVEVDGVLYTENDGDLVDHGDNTWTLTIPEANELTDGIYDVVVTVSDNAGNSANDDTLNEIVIETIKSDLTILKVVDQQHPLVGDEITFTITIVNNGDTNFSNIEIEEEIRSGFSFKNATSSHGEYNSTIGIWSITSLGANETATLHISVTVNATGDFTNTAMIRTSDPIDNDDVNNGVTIEVNLSCLTIYNEFTPNNDGSNDTFRIECIENYPKNRLQIFNRYGSLVYTAKGYKNDWNGIANVRGVISEGKTLPEGTYFYLLQIEELNKVIKGWIYLAK